VQSPEADPWRPEWRRVLLDPLGDPRVLVFRWAFVLGSAAHLWLADPWRTTDWLPANLLYLLGLVLVAWRGAALGFALCALGAAIPVLFHHDQLTQSVLLACMAGAAAWYTGRRQPDQVLDSAKWLAVVTYALAFFHKLNLDFLDERYSCAVYGGQKAAAYWGLELDASAAAVALIGAVLVVEAAIAVLLLVGMRWLAWPLAVAFHIPLTLTMAPAFAFVMFAGHAAFVTREDLRWLGVIWRRCAWMAAPAAVVTAASLALHGSLPEWTMVPKEWLMWWALLALCAAVWDRRSRLFEDFRSPKRPALGVAAVAGFFLLVGLSPYSGLQFQHAAAMLSNLRVDSGCWNHVVVPESARLTDDYVRIDDASLIREGAIPDYEAQLEDHLWGPGLLQYTADNWCKPSVRPFRIRGRFRGRPFLIEDACDGLGPELGAASAGGLLRFQKFLVRDCPQACIH
jgi:hypothetical protein